MNITNMEANRLGNMEHEYPTISMISTDDRYHSFCNSELKKLFCDDGIDNCGSMSLSDFFRLENMGLLLNTTSYTELLIFFKCLENIKACTLFRAITCDFCNMRCRDVNQLLIHKSDHHLRICLDRLKMEEFCCPVCKFFFGSTEILSNHISEHNKKHVKSTPKATTNIIESSLVKPFGSTEILSNHISEDNNKRVKSTAEVMTNIIKSPPVKSTAEVMTNIIKSPPVKPLYACEENQNLCKCKYCSKFFPDTTILSEHLVSEHADITQIKCYTCPKCNFSFSKRSMLLQHFNVSHLNCATCFKKERDIRTYFTHMQRHNTGGITRVVVPVNCGFCNEQFRNKILFINHYENCQGVGNKINEKIELKLQNCKICHRKYLPNLFDKHMSSHELLEANSQCDIQRSKIDFDENYYGNFECSAENDQPLVSVSIDLSSVNNIENADATFSVDLSSGDTEVCAENNETDEINLFQQDLRLDNVKKLNKNSSSPLKIITLEGTIIELDLQSSNLPNNDSSSEIRATDLKLDKDKVSNENQTDKNHESNQVTVENILPENNPVLDDPSSVIDTLKVTLVDLPSLLLGTTNSESMDKCNTEYVSTNNIKFNDLPLLNDNSALIIGSNNNEKSDSNVTEIQSSFVATELSESNRNDNTQSSETTPSPSETQTILSMDIVPSEMNGILVDTDIASLLLPEITSSPSETPKVPSEVNEEKICTLLNTSVSIESLLPEISSSPSETLKVPSDVNEEKICTLLNTSVSMASLLPEISSSQSETLKVPSEVNEEENCTLLDTSVSMASLLPEILSSPSETPKVPSVVSEEENDTLVDTPVSEASLLLLQTMALEVCKRNSELDANSSNLEENVCSSETAGISNDNVTNVNDNRSSIIASKDVSDGGYDVQNQIPQQDSSSGDNNSELNNIDQGSKEEETNVSNGGSKNGSSDNTASNDNNSLEEFVSNEDEMCENKTVSDVSPDIMKRVENNSSTLNDNFSQQDLMNEIDTLNDDLGSLYDVFSDGDTLNEKEEDETAKQLKKCCNFSIVLKDVLAYNKEIISSKTELYVSENETCEQINIEKSHEIPSLKHNGDTVSDDSLDKINVADVKIGSKKREIKRLSVCDADEKISHKKRKIEVQNIAKSEVCDNVLQVRARAKTSLISNLKNPDVGRSESFTGQETKNETVHVNISPKLVNSPLFESNEHNIDIFNANCDSESDNWSELIIEETELIEEPHNDSDEEFSDSDNFCSIYESWKKSIGVDSENVLGENIEIANNSDSVKDNQHFEESVNSPSQIENSKNLADGINGNSEVEISVPNTEDNISSICSSEGQINEVTKSNLGETIEKQNDSNTDSKNVKLKDRVRSKNNCETKLICNQDANSNSSENHSNEFSSKKKCKKRKTEKLTDSNSSENHSNEVSGIISKHKPKRQKPKKETENYFSEKKSDESNSHKKNTDTDNNDNENYSDQFLGGISSKGKPKGQNKEKVTSNHFSENNSDENSSHKQNTEKSDFGSETDSNFTKSPIKPIKLTQCEILDRIKLDIIKNLDNKNCESCSDKNLTTIESNSEKVSRKRISSMSENSDVKMVKFEENTNLNVSDVPDQIPEQTMATGIKTSRPQRMVSSCSENSDVKMVKFEDNTNLNISDEPVRIAEQTITTGIKTSRSQRIIFPSYKIKNSELSIFEKRSNIKKIPKLIIKCEPKNDDNNIHPNSDLEKFKSENLKKKTRFKNLIKKSKLECTSVNDDNNIRSISDLDKSEPEPLKKKKIRFKNLTKKPKLESESKNDDNNIRPISDLEKSESEPLKKKIRFKNLIKKPKLESVSKNGDNNIIPPISDLEKSEPEPLKKKIRFRNLVRKSKLKSDTNIKQINRKKADAGKKSKLRTKPDFSSGENKFINNNNLIPLVNSTLEQSTMYENTFVERIVRDIINSDNINKYFEVVQNDTAHSCNDDDVISKVTDHVMSELCNGIGFVETEDPPENVAEYSNLPRDEESINTSHLELLNESLETLSVDLGNLFNNINSEDKNSIFNENTDQNLLSDTEVIFPVNNFVLDVNEEINEKNLTLVNPICDAVVQEEVTKMIESVDQKTPTKPVKLNRNFKSISTI